MSRYVIQLKANPSLCLGVSSATAGTQVVLATLQGAGSPTTQWECDVNSGTITSAANKDLVLDIQGIAPQDRTPVQINPQVLGRPYQSWNWVGNPSYITNNGAPAFAIDDTGNANPGVGVYLFTQINGNANQMFTFTPVPALERQLEHAGAKR